MSWYDYTLQVQGKPRCKPETRESVELKIIKVENQVVLAKKIGDCDSIIVLNKTLAESIITSGVIGARFYYATGGYYTRIIPGQCKPYIIKTDFYKCDVGEIIPKVKKNI